MILTKYMHLIFQKADSGAWAFRLPVFQGGKCEKLLSWGN